MVVPLTAGQTDTQEAFNALNAWLVEVRRVIVRHAVYVHCVRRQS